MPRTTALPSRAGAATSATAPPTTAAPPSAPGAPTAHAPARPAAGHQAAWTGLPVISRAIPGTTAPNSAGPACGTSSPPTPVPAERPWPAWPTSWASPSATRNASSPKRAAMPEGEPDSRTTERRGRVRCSAVPEDNPPGSWLWIKGSAGDSPPDHHPGPAGDSCPARAVARRPRSDRRFHHLGGPLGRGSGRCECFAVTEDRERPHPARSDGHCRQHRAPQRTATGRRNIHVPPIDCLPAPPRPARDTPAEVLANPGNLTGTSKIPGRVKSVRVAVKMSFSGIAAPLCNGEPSSR
ncbi:hypothetical protein M2169_006029 [Streptomyces sp. MJP52]|nr:hypothetical protein [Streptomyces sp. MJP52]